MVKKTVVFFWASTTQITRVSDDVKKSQHWLGFPRIYRINGAIRVIVVDPQPLFCGCFY